MNDSAFHRPIQRLLCVPARLDKPLPDAVWVTADCGHPVWMAPSGAALWETKRILALCMPCGMATRRGDDPVGIRIDTGQYNELVARVGEAEAKRLMAKHGVTTVQSPD